jgi:hypothetical protein
MREKEIIGCTEGFEVFAHVEKTRITHEYHKEARLAHGAENMTRIV